MSHLPVRCDPTRARAPRLRWYVQLLRLHAARLWALPLRERLRRAVWVACAVGIAALLWHELQSPPPAPPAPGEPKVAMAAINLVVQIALFVISALLSAALAPKPKPPEKLEAKAPVVEDGKGIEDLFGSCWCDDGTVLGFKQMGTKKIRSKGGKKG